MPHLQSHADGPDVFGFQGCLLADQFALIPGFAAAGCGFSAHHGLLKKDGRHRPSSRAKAIPGTDWIHDRQQNKPVTNVTQHHQNAERPVDIQLKSLVRTNFTVVNRGKLAYRVVWERHGE